MTTLDAEPSTEPRTPLTRSRVLTTAVALADREGIGAVTMRNLAHELGVEAMSLYHHVANKDDLLDGIVDAVAGEIAAAVEGIAPPDVPAGWKSALRERILAARTVLMRHRWAPEVIETRVKMSPHIIRHYDALLGLMRLGGLSWDLAHHAMHALGSRALGFTQELFDPGEGEDDGAADFEAMAAELPNMVGMMMAISHDGPDETLGWCDDQTEFVFGLDLILDGLERLTTSA